MGSGSFKFWQLITRGGKERTLARRRYRFGGDRCPLEDLPGREREPTDLKHDVDPKARFVGYCAEARKALMQGIPRLNTQSYPACARPRPAAFRPVDDTNTSRGLAGFQSRRWRSQVGSPRTCANACLSMRRARRRCASSVQAAGARPNRQNQQPDARRLDAWKQMRSAPGCHARRAASR